MDAQEFITKKYEHNNWGLYPPSRRLVGEWLEEFAKEYHTEQLRLGAVSGHVPEDIQTFLHRLRLAEHPEIRKEAIALFERHCR